MTNIYSKPHLLVTATVRPQTSAVRLSDPDERYKQYTDALAQISFKNFSAITVIENSGTDLRQYLEGLCIPVPWEFISYSENRTYAPIAQLEAGMYSKFLEKSKIFTGDEEILKITGRYTVKNISDYLRLPNNIGISFSPTICGHPSAILTSIYKMSGKQFVNFESFLKTAEFSEFPLECLFAGFVRGRNSRPMFIGYPQISGVSGTFAVSYDRNVKEKARVLMSRLLPFGLTWS